MKAKTFTSFKLPAGWVVRNTEKKKGKEVERQRGFGTWRHQARVDIYE